MLLGSETPRIWTPPLRELKPAVLDDDGEVLEPATSLGYAAIEFAEEIVGIGLFPWQKWLLIHSLELREDGSFRFRNIVVLIARQNGKSTLSQILSLFFLFVVGARLVLGTAQDLDTAEEVWDGALELIEGNPDLHNMCLPPRKVNGGKTIRLGTGERYKVKAASRRAGRGLSGDLILLDELREHTNWEAWGAITKTTMARANAQVWALSNAGDVASVVLRYLRKMAHQALGDPDGIVAAEDPSRLLDPDQAEELAVSGDDTLGIFEWSASPGCALDDPNGWAQANPSLGHAITERAILSSMNTDPEWIYRTEVLCQWSDGTLEGPFPAGKWDAGVDAACKAPKDCPGCAAGHHKAGYAGSTIAPGSKIGLCVDVSWDRTKAHIAAAGFRSDGLPHVEVIASRGGTDWVKTWFTDPEHPERLGYDVMIQASGPAGSLIDELEKVKVKVVPWKGEDIGQACGRIYDLVVQNAVKHRPQPLLDIAAATAVVRPLVDTWAWDRKKSPVDCAPLVAVTGAIWLISPRPEDGPPLVHSWPDEDEIKKWEEEALL
jgi:hypothetical protein